MDDKKQYMVPALVRTEKILNLLTNHPKGLRAIDISNDLNISKSSCSVLLKTLENLSWIEKKNNDCYTLGPALGFFGYSYFKEIDLIDLFNTEARKTIEVVDEHIQLGILKRDKVMYLGKIMGSSKVDLVTSPGMLYPSHSTSVGKVQLINFSKPELEEIFSEGLVPVTDFTITSIDTLYEDLQNAKTQGYIEEHQESALGFHCVASPVYNFKGEIIAGVSIAMTSEKWQEKADLARTNIKNLGLKLSYLNGYQKNS